MSVCTAAIFHLLARHVWALWLRTAICSCQFRLLAIHFASACSPCLGSLAPNGYLLTSILPLGDIFFYPLARHVWALGSKRLSRVDSIPLALRPCPLTAIFLWPCGLAPSRRYSFGLAASLAPHGNIPSALRPRSPLTVIFLWPCGLARPSRLYSFGLAVSLAPSRQYSFSLAALLAPHSDIPSALRPRSPLTAKSIFYSPHGECRFYFFLCPLAAKLIFYSPQGRCSFYYSSASSRRYFIRALWG